MDDYRLARFRIKCDSAEQVKERVMFLISKGMVFTTSRYRTWEEITHQYCADYWEYIFVCHTPECQRVINTSSIEHFDCCRDYLTIEFDWFVNVVLPTL